MIHPTIDRIFDAVARVDTSCQLTYVSEQGLQWLGVQSLTQLPQDFSKLLRSEDAEAFLAQVNEQVDNFDCDMRIVNQGKEVWVNIRAYLLVDARQYMLCIIDISQWKSGEASLRHAAEHDELTGLPNRAFLKRAFDQRIKRGVKPFSVALLDLDGFKKVNDTFGHPMGDAVLKETTRRLKKLIGPNDVLARLGGDEFVILLDSTAATASGQLGKVLLAIARPFDTAPHNAYLGVSIGVAEYPAHGDDYSTVLKNADTAMYFSKNAGKNRISVYTESNESADFSIKAAIHKGIEDGEFFLEYQPQYDINRKLVGAEALMRWTGHTFGRVAPDKFIPIVEDSGLMPFLGKWALRFACHQLKRIHESMPDFVMSVNVSPVQFGADDFDALVTAVIAETGIDPNRLVLEITESTLMKSQEKTERALAKLRELGIRFSIDDFGTGFSSLAYLTRLPVSSIKIDKAFIRAIEKPSKDTYADEKLVTAMINLAHSIDLKVVAEGVETEGQFEFLKKSGCNLIQGYLLGKPVSGSTLTALLKEAA